MTLARSVFMGTPVMAIPVLRSLMPLSDVGLVVTRPDRARGRSGRPQPPPVKEAALEAGIEVVQPTDRRDLVRQLSDRGPFEIGVVAAYGMILPAAALAIPRVGMVNIHFSLLPRWRGAAPVVAAISAGDQESGVTLMQMDEGLDTGPVIAAAPVVIGDHETGGVLATRLAVMGGELLTAHLGDWIAGGLTAFPQDESRATHAPTLRPGDRIIDLGLSPDAAARKVRALAPQPGATLLLDGVPHRILAAEPVHDRMKVGEVSIADGDLVVGVTGGGLRLLVLQPPGGRPLDIHSWLRGRRKVPSRAGE